MYLIEKTIQELFKKSSVQCDIKLTAPPKPEMGDLAFACFDIAKEKNKKPNEIALEIANNLQSLIFNLKLIERVESFGPYVNFFLNAGEVAKLIISEVNKKNYGMSEAGKGRKVMIEYSQPNTHKEFHVGHLRNISIGATLVELHKAAGFRVIPVNYIGDIGAHVAKCLWGLTKFHANEKIPANRAKYLGQIYAESSKRADDDLQAKEEIAEVQRKLENGDKKWLALWKKTRAWSLSGFDEIYKELGVKFDRIFYESEVEKEGKNMVGELLKSGVAVRGEGGAVIVDLKQYGLDIFLILKSDGSSLYATKDLALAKTKFNKYKIDRSLYVVDNRQSFYFKQLFKTLQLMGFDRPMAHIAYEFVTLPEGAMSSRTGNVILYEDMRDQVYEKIIAEVKSRHADWSRKKTENTVRVLAIAVLKFTMLQHEATKAITFNLKEAISFDGFSAPYILYVVARINSILRKSKIKNQKSKFLDKLTTNEEKKILLMVGEYGEIIKRALESYNPSVITKYCFDLAQAFNDFYNKHSVLSAENNDLVKARLALCGAVRKVLVDALGLLTIETVDEM